MTTDLSLLAAAPWLTQWLTPIALLGLGALLGLIVLGLLWGVCAAAAKIPLVGTLFETPATRHLVAGGIAVLLVIVSVFVYLIPSFRAWVSTEGLGSALIYTLLSLLLAIVVAYGIGLACVTLVARRTVTDVVTAVSEGVLLWILVLTATLAALGIVITLLVVREPSNLLHSLARLPYTGTFHSTFDIAPAPEQTARTGVGDIGEQEIAVSFNGGELKSFEFESSEPLEVAAESLATASPDVIINVPAQERFSWFRGTQSETTIPDEPISKLYVRNLGQNTARLKLTTVTAPEYPETAAIPVTALAVVAVFLLYLMQRQLLPKLSAVALATTKSEIVQPLYVVLMVIGMFLLLIFVFVPYYTLGDDIKMLKDSGLTLILIINLFIAIWAASRSVADEIEDQTALTVLSKPIRRRDFILGKFVGVLWTSVLLFAVLGVWFLIWIAYKPIYDGRESSTSDQLTWQTCYLEMALIVPGLVLAFMETAVMAALSVAISTRLSLMANVLTCGAIYVLGHLTPLMVQSSLNQFEIVTFVARLIATLFPLLDHFNIQTAIAGGTAVPLEYLGWAFLYCALYSTIAMLLALVLFEDRDMA